MDYDILGPVILLSGIIGFIVFSVSHAHRVWRRRNGGANSSTTAMGTVGRVLAVSGAVAIVLSLALREFPDRAGLLSGDSLFVVRYPDRFEVQHVLVEENASVEAGQVLARFESPAQEAQIRYQSLRKGLLAKQRQELANKPLELDANLVRAHQEALGDVRQFRGALMQLVPTYQLVARESFERILDTDNRLIELDRVVFDHEKQVEATAAQLELSNQRLEQIQKIVQNAAGVQMEVSESETTVRVLETEQRRLQEQLEQLRRQHAVTEGALPGYRRLTEGQRDQLMGQITVAETELEKAQALVSRLDQQLDQDRDRASEVRRAQLEQIDIELEQSDAKLAGLRRQMEIDAPFAGRVIYRDLAPRAAAEDDPVLVLAPQEGFRIRVRLPAGEMSALSETEAVKMVLHDPMIERHFTGRFLKSRRLPEDRRYGVAELACSLPRETVRELARGTQIKASLKWRPPLYVIPIFIPGVVAGVVGCGLSVVGRRRSEHDKAADVSREVSQQPAIGPHAEAGVAHDKVLIGLAEAASNAEHGPVGPVLRTLGRQLREGVLQRAVDEPLVRSIQWALDRHHVRAIKLIREGLCEDQQLLNAWMGWLQDHRNSDSRSAVAAVFKAVAPRFVSEPVRASSDQHAPVESQERTP